MRPMRCCRPHKNAHVPLKTALTEATYTPQLHRWALSHQPAAHTGGLLAACKIAATCFVTTAHHKLQV
jgi:hypothetical protein